MIVNPLPRGLAEAAKKRQAGDKSEPGMLRIRASRLVHRQRPQLSAVLTRNVLVTHHYQPLGCVDEGRAFIDRHGASARRGPDYLFHLILDGVVDEYAPVVDRIASGLVPCRRP